MPEHSRSFPANTPSHLAPARAQEAAKNPKFEDKARELKSKAEQASTLGRLELPAGLEDKTRRGAGSSGILNGILHDEKGGKFTVESEGGWNTGHAPHLHILTETHVFEPVAPPWTSCKKLFGCVLFVLARSPVDLGVKSQELDPRLVTLMHFTLQNGESSRRLKVAATVAGHFVVKPSRAAAASAAMASAQRLLPPVIVEDEGGACEQPWRAVLACCLSVRSACSAAKRLQCMPLLCPFSLLSTASLYCST
jgi:hypothetical protein